MQVEHAGGIQILNMPARLDAMTVASLEPDFDAAVSAHGGKTLVDMGDVNFLASLALRMLLTSLKRVQAKGGDLRLCGMQPQVAEVFRKSRFDTLFRIYANRDSALADY